MGVKYLGPEGLASSGAAETGGRSPAHLVVAVGLQARQGAKRGAQGEELGEAPPPELRQHPPPLGTLQGGDQVH